VDYTRLSSCVRHRIEDTLCRGGYISRNPNLGSAPASRLTITPWFAHAF
jgi:hypothetical protein